MSTIFCGWFSILSSLLKNEHALTHVKNWTEYSDQIIYFLITFWIIQLRPRIFIVFNLFSETNSGFILIFTWSVFQISVKTLFCYIAKPEYWIYVMKISRIREIGFMFMTISRIREINFMLWQSQGSGFSNFRENTAKLWYWIYVMTILRIRNVLI